VALSNLAARVLFALVAIPVALGAAYLGDLTLSLLLALVSGVAAWEFFRLASAGGYEPLPAVGIPLAAALPLAVRAYHVGRFTPPVLTLGAAVVLSLLALTIWLRGPQRRPIGAAAATVFGVLYTGGMLCFAYALRYHNYTVDAPSGTVLLLYPLLITWTSDTGAFAVGRAVGRRKLIPSVSPGKTVEGALGALALSALVSWLYAQLMLTRFAQLGLAPWSAVLFGVAISAVVQLGDLAESLIKREVGAKDSSHLIPGHGGVLDRIDGMIFALPTAYLLFTLPRFLLPVVR
jgi:phosphatidate cytidylyltransferase